MKPLFLQLGLIGLTGLLLSRFKAESTEIGHPFIPLALITFVIILLFMIEWYVGDD